MCARALACGCVHASVSVFMKRTEEMRVTVAAAMVEAVVLIPVLTELARNTDIHSDLYPRNARCRQSPLHRLQSLVRSTATWPSLVAMVTAGSSGQCRQVRVPATCVSSISD